MTPIPTTTNPHIASAADAAGEVIALGTADRQDHADAAGFVTWDLPKPELRVEDQLQPDSSPVCEDCDTVDHCMRCGCVPKVPLAASVQGTPAPRVPDDGAEWEQAARDVLANPRPIADIKRDIDKVRERIAASPAADQQEGGV